MSELPVDVEAPDPVENDTVHTRARSTRARSRIGLNLTSMIDVTFLLLVYFMVATEFKLGEEVYRLDLPDRRASTQDRDPFELDEEPLRISVASTGRSRLAYRLRLEGPYEQPTTFEELRAFLDQRRITSTSSGLFEPDHPIIIEPTRTTTWQHAIEAFDAAARARYTNITLGMAR